MGKLQDGIAIKRINDAITTFKNYKLDELEQGGSMAINTLSNVRAHVGLAWPAILRNCLIHTSSHLGFMKFMIDIATTWKVGAFTLLGSVGDEDPFTDVDLIYTKTCLHLGLKDNDFLQFPEEFAYEANSFLEAQSMNARVDMLTGVHNIEDKYVFRMQSISKFLKAYYTASEDVAYLTGFIKPDDSKDSILSAELLKAQVTSEVLRVRNLITTKIQKYINLYEDSQLPHFRQAALSYTQDWDVDGGVPAALPQPDITDDESPVTNPGPSAPPVSKGADQPEDEEMIRKKVETSKDAPPKAVPSGNVSARGIPAFLEDDMSEMDAPDGFHDYLTREHENNFDLAQLGLAPSV
uniref:Minor outer capsid protein P9 n=1 Tax=Rice dwarf virus (isolate O) TaxID=142805 RepID=P9_RDVO|nr:RecName: Full=Minor outer capsid protein P9 [Rice dwarf virus (isolate O)]BAA02668.1 38.9K polypeptide [Rice dwarf virus]prf//1613134A genome segment S9 ORF [Rice dwarf virus]